MEKKRDSREWQQTELAIREPGIGHLHMGEGPAQLTRNFLDGESMSLISVTFSDGELITK